MNDLKINEIIKNIIDLEKEIEVLKCTNFFNLKKQIINQKKTQLEELNEKRSELVDSSKLAQYLNTNKIRLNLAENIAKNKLIPYECSLMRDSMARQWGYILPLINIRECQELNDFEFEIEIQGEKIAEIFKANEKLNMQDLANFIIAKLQTILFENANKILSIHDMYTYIGIIREDETQNSEFWDDIRWLAWELKYYIPELLQERRCIRNITALSNKIIDLRYIQNKSEFYTLDILRKNLPQYPEELFFSDWIIGID